MTAIVLILELILTLLEIPHALSYKTLVTPNESTLTLEEQFIRSKKLFDELVKISSFDKNYKKNNPEKTKKLKIQALNIFDELDNTNNAVADFYLRAISFYVTAGQVYKFEFKRRKQETVKQIVARIRMTDNLDEKALFIDVFRIAFAQAKKERLALLHSDSDSDHACNMLRIGQILCPPEYYELFENYIRKVTKPMYGYAWDFYSLQHNSSADSLRGAVRVLFGLNKNSDEAILDKFLKILLEKEAAMISTQLACCRSMVSPFPKAMELGFTTVNDVKTPTLFQARNSSKFDESEINLKAQLKLLMDERERLAEQLTALSMQQRQVLSQYGSVADKIETLQNQLLQQAAKEGTHIEIKRKSDH